MRFLRKGAATLLLCAGATLASAQTPIQPGQLATALQVRAGSNDVAANASNPMPHVTIAAPEGSHTAFMNRLWVASIFADIAGTSLDAATSWGRREGNPLLAGSNGTFGMRGVSIKAAIAAVVIVPQICLRKRNDLKGVFAMGNFGEAAIFAGTSVHNLEVRSAATVY